MTIKLSNGFHLLRYHYFSKIYFKRKYRSINHFLTLSHKESCLLVLCRLFILITWSGADIKKALIETSLRKLYICKRALVTNTAHCNILQKKKEYQSGHKS